VLFDKIVSLFFIWKKYLTILALEMANPGKRHYVNCIGALSFPIVRFAFASHFLFNTLASSFVRIRKEKYFYT